MTNKKILEKSLMKRFLEKSFMKDFGNISNNLFWKHFSNKLFWKNHKLTLNSSHAIKAYLSERVDELTQNMFSTCFSKISNADFWVIKLIKFTFNE